MATQQAAAPSPAQSVTFTASKYQGILPPPDMLASYNDVVENGAERIFRMAELNSEHRRGLEAMSVRAEHTRSMVGVVIGGIVALTIAVCGTIVTVKGYPEVGITMVGGDLLGIVGSFVYGTESRKRERLERTELMTGQKR